MCFLHSGALSSLSYRRIPSNPTQWTQGYHSPSSHWSLQRCHDWTPLQKLSGGSLMDAMANQQDQARADIAARGFWNKHQRAFFDVRICNPFAQSYKTSSLCSCHKKNESEKSRAYDQRIHEVKCGTFSPSSLLLQLWATLQSLSTKGLPQQFQRKMDSRTLSYFTG